MPLASLHGPFDHPDWIFELYDGFRALAYIDSGQCRLVSRRGTAYKSFPKLCEPVAGAIPRQAVLDGEKVDLDSDGKPLFYDLMRRRSPEHFYAFDLLWLNGRDLWEWPLIERKRLLSNARVLSVLYADHIEARGLGLFEAACSQDLEGILAKLASGRYEPEMTTWVRIKNRSYSQADGRDDFFDERARKLAVADLKGGS